MRWCWQACPFMMGCWEAYGFGKSMDVTSARPSVPRRDDHVTLFIIQHPFGTKQTFLSETRCRFLRTEFPFFQIQVAKKFGCSVQPRCKGSALFTCLFSPAYVSLSICFHVATMEVMVTLCHPEFLSFLCSFLMVFFVSDPLSLFPRE